jgi:hypothetical protein
MINYWSFVLIVLPLFLRIEPFVDLRFQKDYFFIFSSFVGVILFGLGKTDKTTRIVLVSFVALAFFNQVKSTNEAAFFQFMCLSSAAILIPHFKSRIDSEFIDRIQTTFFYVLLIQCLYTTLQNFNLYPIEAFLPRYVNYAGKWLPAADVPKITPPGSLGNQNYTSGLIAALLPFCLSWRRAPIFIWAIICLYLQESALGWVGAAGGLWIVWFVKTKRKMLLFSISSIIGLIGLWFMIQHPFFRAGDRLLMWPFIVYFGLHKPLFGWGPGAFRTHFHGFLHSPQVSKLHEIPKDMQSFREPHCDYLSLFVTFGVIGIILAGLLLSKIKFDKEKALFLGSFGSILINATGNFPFHISAISLVAIICYSIISINKGVLE